VWCLIAVRLKDDKSIKFHQMHKPGDSISSNKPPYNKKTALNKIGILYAVDLTKK